MKRILLLATLLFPIVNFAQSCDCSSTFDWVKQTFEENDAGFQYIIDKKGQLAYDLHNKMIYQKLDKLETARECQTTIREWLKFFRKAHVEFYYTGEFEDKDEATSELSMNEGVSGVFDDPDYDLNQKAMNSEIPFLISKNKSTLYLRIPSFGGGEKHLIDSVIATNRDEILRTENLIIDIRNGTGGSDVSYEELMPFLYTNPIRMPNVEFLSTTLNNQRMYDLANNTGLAIQFGINSTKEEMKEFQADYEKLNSHLGEFVNLEETAVTITEFDSVYPFPKNVGIIINHNNVSTDEQFLLEAKQSKKVKLFGTTTMGALDVSNLNLAYSPNKDFLLVYALSKSLRIPNMVVDDIGIKPDYFIDDEIEEWQWIRYTSEILNE